MIALLLAPALAQPAPAPVADPAADPGLAPTLSPRYDEALRCEQDGDLDQAAFLYRLADAEQPNIHRSALGLGRVLEKLGRAEQALRVYRRLPDDPDAVEAEGRLLLGLERDGEAADAFDRLRELRPEWPGTRVLQAEALAGSDPERAAGLLEEYLEFSDIDPIPDGVVGAAERVGRGLVGQGNHAAAHGLLSDVRDRFRADPAVEPALAPLEPLLAGIEVDEAARALAGANDVPLTPDQGARLRAAREAFADGDGARASEGLEALIAEQPSSAVCWATLADVRQARGDPAGAEAAIDAAERLDPLVAAYPAKLGEILAGSYGGRFDGEAADAYARAVMRRADDPELWWSKALVERRAGRRARAAASFARVVELDPDGPHAAEARRELEGFQRSRPAPVALPGEPRPDGVPEPAWWAFHRARAWTQRPEPDATEHALAELQIARDLAPRFVPALDLLAAITAEQGDLPHAIALYEESLRIEPDRGRVWGTLAALYARAGDPRVAEARRKAADLGDPDALWRRAREEAADLRWWRARATLDEFFLHTTGGPAYEQALQLDAELASRIRAARIGAGAVGVALLLAPAGYAVRRRSGIGLAALVRRDPATARDVARVCAAIRHEVLKHHVSVLPNAISALEDGDREPLRWLCERLLGAEGPLDQLHRYVDELEGLAAARGLRLNLWWRDPVFGPMLRAFQRLERLGNQVLTSRADPPRLSAQLRAVSEALNGAAYRGLGGLLGRMSRQRVDGALLREVYDAVRGEPEFRGEEFPELRLHTADPAPSVRMSRADLTDVLTNLLRNAAQASRGAGADAVGIAVGTEEDEITALLSVVIRVRDQVPGGLTTAALRGREGGRGLGLAVDLTTRAGGSVRVEDDPGWAKAVVVRVPAAEDAPG